MCRIFGLSCHACFVLSARGKMRQVGEVVACHRCLTPAPFAQISRASSQWQMLHLVPLHSTPRLRIHHTSCLITFANASHSICTCSSTFQLILQRPQRSMRTSISGRRANRRDDAPLAAAAVVPLLRGLITATIITLAPSFAFGRRPLFLASLVLAENSCARGSGPSRHHAQSLGNEASSFS